MCVNLIFLVFLYCFVIFLRAVTMVVGVVPNISLLVFNEIKAADTESWNYKE